MDIKNEKRPWGEFRLFSKNETTTVKLISVDAEKSLSLQYHNQRSEFWRVISGHPTIIVGDKIVSATPGDEFFIPEKTPHRIRTTDGPAQILEISFGQFDEEDIVRLEDEYGRIQ
jgi:mannose-6-phosphate isomerase-like protein (cupin superfamily)